MRKNNLLNYSYSRLILELIKLSHLHRYQYKIIGEEIFEDIKLTYPLYKFTINPQAKVKFCIVAGLHGYEIAGPLTMPALFTRHEEYLDKRIGYHIFPVLNPSSFDLRRRLNDDGRDLNILDKHILKKKGYREIKAFYDEVKNKKYEVLLDLHEDVSIEKFYAYIFEKQPTPIYRQIIKSANKYTPILRQKKIYGAPSHRDGLIINQHDRSLEDRLYCLKNAVISLCTETPGKLKLDTRIQMNLENIKILNSYILKKL